MIQLGTAGKEEVLIGDKSRMPQPGHEEGAAAGEPPGGPVAAVASVTAVGVS